MDCVHAGTLCDMFVVLGVWAFLWCWECVWMWMGVSVSFVLGVWVWWVQSSATLTDSDVMIAGCFML